VPFSVLLAVPSGSSSYPDTDLCSPADQYVYAQIGMITLIGLAAKKRHPDRGIRQGAGRQRGTARNGYAGGVPLRLRPILMTSLAFILGVLPLVFATGPALLPVIPLGSLYLGGCFPRPCWPFHRAVLFVVITRSAYVRRSWRSCRSKGRIWRNNIAPNPMSEEFRQTCFVTVFLTHTFALLGYVRASFLAHPR